MKLSRYALVHGEYLFSTVYLTVARVGKHVADALKSGNIEHMPEHVKNVLLEAGYLVEDGFDEKAFVEYRLRSQRYDARSLSVTYIPGYKCNFACTYCYASLQVHGVPLDERPHNNLDKLIGWLSNYLSTMQPRLLSFAFHGGEPLMYTNYVIDVAKAVTKLASRHDVNVEYNVVSNGSLLSQGVYERLREVNINKFLITVDGPPNVHDSRRISRNGKSSFDRILSNALNVLENAGTVIISANVDSGNKEHIHELIDRLVERGFTHYPSFRFVVASVLKGPGSELLSHYEKFQPLDLKEFAKVKVDAYRYATQKGIRTSYPFGIGLCSLKLPNSFIIDSNSNIYKCTTLVGHNESWVGSLDDDLEVIARRISQLDMAEPWVKDETCQQCVYLPMCVGGCPQQAMLTKPQTPFPHAVWCPKDFLDVYTPSILGILEERNRRFPELAQVD